jgi:hypothetical protein
MPPAVREIVLSPEELTLLRAWARQRPRERALGAEILLGAARGWTNECIAPDLAIARNTVNDWRERYLAEGMLCFSPKRSGRIARPASPEKSSAQYVLATPRRRAISKHAHVRPDITT